MMENDRANVVFLPSGHRGVVKKGVTITEASRQLGVGLETLCGGQRVCGKCKVCIAEGAYPEYEILSSRTHVSDWDRVEDDFINDSQRMKGYRLACCARIEADVAVFVPEESRAGKQVVSKAARDIRINHDPAVKAIKSSLLAMLPVMGQGSLFSIAKNEWKRPGLPASWNMSN